MRVHMCTCMGACVFALLLSVSLQVMTFMDWLYQIKGETAI